MAAPPAVVERDALAACVILARLFACRDVGDFPRRLTLVGLTGARVALGVGADLRPRTLNCCRVDERVVYDVWLTRGCPIMCQHSLHGQPCEWAEAGNHLPILPVKVMSMVGWVVVVVNWVVVVVNWMVVG